MIDFLKGPDNGNTVLFVAILLISMFSLYGFTEADAPEVEYIETVDVPFSRCTCDSAIYCLTDEEYTIVMAQLAGRNEVIKKVKISEKKG